MKNILRILIINFLVTHVTMADNATRRIDLGLTHYSPDDRPRIERFVFQLVLERASGGSEIIVSDAYQLQTIARFEIPKLRFDTVAARARILRRDLATLKAWFNVDPPNQIPQSLRGRARARPEWFDYLAKQPTNQLRAILLIASPLTATKEESFSMEGGRYPSDGHLLVGRRQSVFGTADREGQLRVSAVHWIFPENVWQNSIHEERVRRFWSMFVSRQGGLLVTFGVDLNGALDRLMRPDLPAVGEFTIDANDNAIMMHLARPRKIQEKETNQTSIQMPVKKREGESRDSVLVPPGAKPEILSLRSSSDGLQIDMVIEDAVGRQIHGLTEKDFSIFLGGYKAENFQFSEHNPPTVPLRLVLGIDVSSSMANALPVAVAAAQELLRSIADSNGETWVKVMTYGSECQTLCPWTDQINVAIASLVGLRANGGTALFKAVELGFDDLKSGDGRRRLVLFTDGRNNQIWLGSRDSLVGKFKKSEIPIFVIGLKTDDLDPETLNFLADQTGGEYFESESIGDLAASFQKTGREINQTFYRLIINSKPNPAGRWPEVAIGIGNGYPSILAENALKGEYQHLRQP